MIFKDYYKILGLDTNKVNIDEIKVAYREQAKRYHPDVNLGNKSAEERFKDINEAYNKLSDATSKKKYDRMWNSKIGKKRAREEKKETKKVSAAEEVLNMFFGAQADKSTVNKKAIKTKNIPVQGENIETEIDVTIEEAFYGNVKKISLRTVEGKMKTFEIKIPEGIRDGEKIRLIGQGKEGKNGGKNGDLLIKTRIVNDNNFKLVGTDIYSQILVTPWEAVLGAKVNANAIDEEIAVYIPKGSETGEEISIPGKGYKDGKGGRGNLILQVKIMIQKNISNEEKELYKKLKKISKFNPRQSFM